jgi:hypothetical protein
MGIERNTEIGAESIFRWRFTHLMNSNVYLSALLPEARASVLPLLHGVICDAGGWILSRSYFEACVANVVFEFPRDISVEIYSALVSLGLEFVPSSQLALAELCRCAPYLYDMPTRSIPSADEASLEEATMDFCSLELVKIELDIQFEARETLPGAC